jgi:hypothetical protein
MPNWIHIFFEVSGIVAWVIALYWITKIWRATRKGYRRRW